MAFMLSVSEPLSVELSDEPDNEVGIPGLDSIHNDIFIRLHRECFKVDSAHC